MNSGIVKAEYIWIDGHGKLRSKTKICASYPHELEDLSTWNYDGSSTAQAPGNNSEVILRPKKTIADPFRGIPHILVLCDTWLPDGNPHPTNKRVEAEKIFNKCEELDPWFGMEQEFFLSKDGIPIAFLSDKKPSVQGEYYCGVGGDNAIGRECIEEAFDKCLEAGLRVVGLNAEVAPSQWEIQLLGKGIDASDQMYLMRYIIDRTAEKYGWTIDLRPKPLKGDWNGSGCHTNFSTKPMRESKNGMELILNAIEKLSKNHKEHMKDYGEGNQERMTGVHETASYDTFSSGVANRGASIRIPVMTSRNGCGYFEDRRPASNMNPYQVTSLLFKTTSLDN